MKIQFRWKYIHRWKAQTSNLPLTKYAILRYYVKKKREIKVIF